MKKIFFSSFSSFLFKPEVKQQQTRFVQVYRVIPPNCMLEAVNCTFLTVTGPARAVISRKPQCFTQRNQTFLLFKM